MIDKLKATRKEHCRYKAGTTFKVDGGVMEGKAFLAQDEGSLGSIDLSYWRYESSSPRPTMHSRAKETVLVYGLNPLTHKQQAISTRLASLNSSTKRASNTFKDNSQQTINHSMSDWLPPWLRNKTPKAKSKIKSTNHTHFQAPHQTTAQLSLKETIFVY